MTALPLQLVRKTFALWWKHWPPLVLLVLVGYVLESWLMRGIVEIGLRNHVLGLSLLAPLVVLELGIVIAMFHWLRPSLPALTQPAAASTAPASDRLTAALALALVPFFAYYAAWGLLGDTIRDYSLAGLARDPFGQYGPLLDALKSSGLVLSVAVSWLLRHYAKAREAKQHSPWWQALIVLCEANWVFIGLFVVTRAKDGAMKWLHSRAVWDYFGGAAPDLATPVVTPGLLDLLSNAAQGLFLAALLPLVWLAITALIFGRDLGEQALLASNRRIERVVTGYDALPSPLKKFGDDFVKGYRTRYVPVANSVRMTLQAGLGLLLAFCVGYRALDWLSVQAWIALTQWMGPHPMEFWRPVGDALALVVGGPLGSAPSIVFEPLRICLLAATLELGVAAWLQRPATATEPTEPTESAQLQAQ
jgi:hypothetical protein